ncbi:hypothetical protein [Burkholderia gladioli]|uniref:hypothetical protein n=1 Tax=Burkholderia gladioli TaxID=28095 RepID=UPI00163F4122|nr:hypothetical protein [Burkholderia gladioli]
MSESKQQLIAEKERVWDQDGELVATVWARRPDETRLPGEAWIDMRTRIGPALDAAVQETISLARQFAAAPELVEALQAAMRAASDTLFVLREMLENDYEHTHPRLENLAEALDKATDVGYAALAKAGA